MRTEINEPREGDYFTVQDGEDGWPVVIGNEEMIRTFFTRQPRPKSARQADGTWWKDYKPGGSLVSKRRFPAIKLGTLEFRWVSLRELYPLDIDMGRVVQSSTSNPLLAKAWSEYTGQFKGDDFLEWRNLDYWKAKLHAQRLDKSTPVAFKKEKVPAEKIHPRVKRKGTPNFKYPRGYCYDELDDEEPNDLFLLSGNPAEPNIKQESINSMSSEEMDALYDDADPPYLASSESSKRSKLDASGRFSMRPSTPSSSTDSPTTPTLFPGRRGTPLYPTNMKTDYKDPDMVLIYVDNPHKKFKVKRSGLNASPLLSKLLTHHSENGWYIMSPMLSSLHANDFRPVGEYIDRREYHPNILDDGTAHVRLEGDLSPEVLRQEVVRCGRLYQMAQMLEMPGLRDLAFRKLQALAPYHQALEILTVIESLFEIGGPDIRQYLTRHVAEHYWTLVLAETEKMVVVMRGNEDLAKGVFRMLSGLNDEEEDVKMEGVVKEEVGKKEEEEEVSSAVKGRRAKKRCYQRHTNIANITNNAQDQSDRTNNNTNNNNNNNIKKWILYNKTPTPNPHTNSMPTNSENENENGTLTPAEAEMIKLALRQSLEEGAERADEDEEEDWIKLVERQREVDLV